MNPTDRSTPAVPGCIPAIGKEEIEAVADVLRSGWLAHGPKNHDFEKAFQAYLGVKHAITMNSCASALQVAVEMLGIQGEVITPSFTFVATVNAIVLAGATPVFVDVDRDTRNMSASCIEAAITPQTEAIMVVHYAGLPADMPTILAIARKHHLQVIEDSAECLGGQYHGTFAGSETTGCFSFFPTKNIATGEGGILTTNDDDLARRVRGRIAHGIDSTTFAREKADKPWIRIASQPGYNFRMSNVLAAIGAEQMKKIDRLNAQRAERVAQYRDELASVSQVEFPCAPEGFVHSWQMLTVLVPPSTRDELLLALREKNIGVSVHFDPPVHKHPPYVDVRAGTDLKVTEELAESIVTLPLYPDMRPEDVVYVCQAIRSFFK